jgi:hypothetical protein
MDDHEHHTPKCQACEQRRIDELDKKVNSLLSYVENVKHNNDKSNETAVYIMFAVCAGSILMNTEAFKTFKQTYNL